MADSLDLVFVHLKCRYNCRSALTTFLLRVGKSTAMQPEGKVTIHLNFYSAFEEWSQRYEIDPFYSGTRSPPSSPSLNEALGVDQWHYGRESDVSMVEDRYTGSLLLQSKSVCLINHKLHRSRESVFGIKRGWRELPVAGTGYIYKKGSIDTGYA